MQLAARWEQDSIPHSPALLKITIYGCIMMVTGCNILQHVLMTRDSTQALYPLPAGHRYLHVRKCMGGSWSGWAPGLRPWQQDADSQLAGCSWISLHDYIKASHILMKYPYPFKYHEIMLIVQQVPYQRLRSRRKRESRGQYRYCL